MIEINDEDISKLKSISRDLGNLIAYSQFEWETEYVESLINEKNWFDKKFGVPNSPDQKQLIDILDTIPNVKSIICNVTVADEEYMVKGDVTLTFYYKKTKFFVIVCSDIFSKFLKKVYNTLDRIISSMEGQPVFLYKDDEIMDRIAMNPKNWVKFEKESIRNYLLNFEEPK